MNKYYYDEGLDQYKPKDWQPVVHKHNPELDKTCEVIKESEFITTICNYHPKLKNIYLGIDDKESRVLLMLSAFQKYQELYNVYLDNLQMSVLDVANKMIDKAHQLVAGDYNHQGKLITKGDILELKHKGLNNTQIAVHLGTSVSTVKRRLNG